MKKSLEPFLINNYSKLNSHLLKIQFCASENYLLSRAGMLAIGIFFVPFLVIYSWIPERIIFLDNTESLRYDIPGFLGNPPLN